MRNNIKSIISLISKVLGIKKGLINENSKAKDFKKWDSLGTIKISIALEHQYKIKVSNKEINNLDSIKSIYKYLQKTKI